MPRRPTTLIVKVICKICGTYMFDSDQEESVMCFYCHEKNIENTKLARLEMLEENNEDERYVRPFEHPDSKNY